MNIYSCKKYFVTDQQVFQFLRLGEITACFLIMDYKIRPLHPGMYTAKKYRTKLVQRYSKPKRKQDP
jgi:hypothetical protein